MEKLKIVGGNRLYGEVKISTAKNAILPIMAASLLINGETKILDFPHFSDCYTMLEILEKFGAKTSIVNESVKIESANIKSFVIETSLAEKMRSSFFTFGAILARCGKAIFSYPGGCNIGSRPVDMHIKAFKDLGIDIVEKHGYIYAERKNFSGGVVYLDFPSVGVTENVMMLACTLNGLTVIKNPAKEPEIVDLQNFLNCAGAKIEGAGTDVITIQGVGKLLNGISYTCIGDRIIAGTYAIATSCIGGIVKLNNINPTHLQDLIDKLRKADICVIESKDSISIIAERRPTSIPIVQTMPYPYFPTDLQSQFTVMQSISKGNSIIVENIFESRLGYVSQLTKMGAKIKVKNNIAFVEGVETLLGAEVYAPDLRAGAGLVIAGLCAKGYTTINNVHFIDRGYESIEKDLSSLGANIIREKNN